MGKRRRQLALPASDDDDDAPPPPPPPRRSQSHFSNEEERANNNRIQTRNRRKKMKLGLEEGDEDEEDVAKKKNSKKRAVEEKVEAEEEEEQEVEEEEEVVDAIPIGEPIRVSGRGRTKRSVYKAFELDGLQYEIEDPVLLVSEGGDQKPYVAIIKEILVDAKGDMSILGQWFYRPEEAEKKSGGNWQSRDTRELFYSFHRDEVPAESVMHKCKVHFIPLHKQIPSRKEHPGFIVQKVYDTEGKRLFKLTDKDYEDNKQEEIDLLVQKTLAQIGNLPDLDPEDIAPELEEQLKSKRLLRRKNMAPLDVSREDEGAARSGQALKAGTPGSCASEASEYYKILLQFKVLTGDALRDKWLEKVLEGLQFVCTSVDGGQTDGKAKSSSDSVPNESQPQDKNLEDVVSIPIPWPDKAVPAVVALENAAYEANSDFQKYMKKMRQLNFNLRSNAVLAKRLLNAELEPSQILNMSPSELKEGLTAEENVSRQPEESEHMQMTNVRCNRCLEKKVGVLDIMQSGNDYRYQLECSLCGCKWSASRDEAASLMISSVNVSKSAEMEDAEKLVSPGGSERATADDVVKKTSKAHVPVLDNQKSFNKARPADNSGAPDAE